MRKASLIFPHQLFEDHPIHKFSDELYLIEESLFFKEINFHKNKIAYHRATMKYFEKYLQKKGIKVIYINSSESISDIRILIKNLSIKGYSHIAYIDPTDNWLEKRIIESSTKYGIDLSSFENPLFINSKNELEEYFKPELKAYFQTSFYNWQRKYRSILLEENGKPQGGKWSFDSENRKKYPKNKKPPTIFHPENNSYWIEAVQYVKLNFPNNPGFIENHPYFPINRNESLIWLNQFFEFRFNDFGIYEDAILQEEIFLNHSVITPMLNIGLISPSEVIDKAIKYSNKNNIPLNSTEGFIRQILGWREFIRGVYQDKGSYSRTKNHWGFKRKIPKSFYDGSTGIKPIDITIKKLLKTSYTHHIERLMILGNFMLLCEFDPDEVYKWFMELYIDAYDWVMVPNIYGMSQFADGGLFASKPYISGSNYVLKMSDYKKGDWQKTWDGLFWRFMDVHRDFFLSNPRLSMLVRSYDKMPNEKKLEHHKNAEEFMNKLDKS